MKSTGLPRQAACWPVAQPDNSSGLLIRGFRVRVPAGQSVLFI